MPHDTRSTAVRRLRKSLRGLACLMCAIWSFSSYATDSVSEHKYRIYYLESVVQREAGHYGAQQMLLSKALQYKPNAAEAVFDLAEVSSQNPLCSEEQVDALYRKSIRLWPENNEYRWQFAKYQIAHAQLDSAIVLLRTLTNDDQRRYSAYSLLANIYDRRGQDSLLLQVLREWEGDEASAETIGQMKYRALSRMHRYDEALAWADTLAHTYRDNDYYLALRADALLQRGDTAQALAANNQIMAESSDNSYGQLFLVRYYQSKGDQRRLEHEIEQVVLNPKQDTDVRDDFFKTIIKTYKGSDRQGLIDSLFARLLDQPMDDTDLLDTYTSYLTSLHAPDSAYADVMEKYLEIDPSDRQNRLREAWALFKRLDYPKVIASCKQGIEYHPEELIFYLLGGNSATILKQRDTAMSFFESGKSHVSGYKDADIRSDYYSAYGDLLHEAGRLKESYAMYDSSLVCNPANVSTLNNYAYFLSLADSAMDKAHEMAALAIKYSPDEPTFLDTYAWVLFVQGDYSGAKIYIDKAQQRLKTSSPQDASLYEHAGDIYSQLGDTQQALQAWKKALKMGNASKILRQKIKYKRYIKP